MAPKRISTLTSEEHIRQRLCERALMPHPIGLARRFTFAVSFNVLAACRCADATQELTDKIVSRWLQTKSATLFEDGDVNAGPRYCSLRTARPVSPAADPAIITRTIYEEIVRGTPLKIVTEKRMCLHRC